MIGVPAALAHEPLLLRNGKPQRPLGFTVNPTAERAHTIAFVNEAGAQTEAELQGTSEQRWTQKRLAVASRHGPAGDSESAARADIKRGAWIR